MANMFMKKHSVSLIIKGNANPITLMRKYHLTPVKMAIIKNIKGKYSWRMWKIRNTCTHSWWACKMERLIWIRI